MTKLYYSPGSCSLAVHIALREAGLEHSLVRVATREGEHLTEEYAKVNPLKRIPTLVTAQGKTLTEVPALLWHIAAQTRERKLLPLEGPEAVSCIEWMSLLTSAVHPPFSLFYSPRRWFSNETIYDDVRSQCHGQFWEMLRHVESRLPVEQCVLGGSFSLLDPYCAVFYWWGGRTGLPVVELPRYTALARQVRRRSATREALQIEGLADVIVEL